MPKRARRGEERWDDAERRDAERREERVGERAMRRRGDVRTRSPRRRVSPLRVAPRALAPPPPPSSPRPLLQSGACDAPFDLASKWVLGERRRRATCVESQRLKVTARQREESGRGLVVGAEHSKLDVVPIDPICTLRYF